MSIRGDILQAVRGWLKAASSLTDAQVIPADDIGPRPALPYLTVKVVVADLPVGEDETRYALNGDDDPTVTVHGTRRGTVSVQGYGAAAEEWLVTARLALRLPTIQATLNTAGLTVVPIGAPRDVAVVLDTSFEARVVWDLEVLYDVSSAAEEEIAAAIATVTSVLSPGALTTTSTLDLT
jgi:hypothetical protein